MTEQRGYLKVIMRLFGKVVDTVIALMVPLVSLALVLGVARLFLDLKDVFHSPTIAGGFDLMITNILSMFIVVELLRSIIDYFAVHRLKITFITDAAIVFIVREVMVGLYRHNMAALEIISLGVILMVIGCIRTLAIVYSPEISKEGMFHE